MELPKYTTCQKLCRRVRALHFRWDAPASVPSMSHHCGHYQQVGSELCHLPPAAGLRGHGEGHVCLLGVLEPQGLWQMCCVPVLAGWVCMLGDFVFERNALEGGGDITIDVNEIAGSLSHQEFCTNFNRNSIVLFKFICLNSSAFSQLIQTHRAIFITDWTHSFFYIEVKAKQNVVLLSC